ncbi:hypothetical protein [Phytomonospora endophytica]|uniref:Uncharacterized protein n=1 Tax=Phytomonospora endophytica TaxID=714109 RepID=A0A841FNU0_9ACTN|nr:hypothetical protein [Phytomonospora endophytica]MBB6035222.1 hypothetical protein [Phytomonospora endophytica]GIG64029.1 hypothetical protein Pen01_03240 [Phytomonospora endophytica]
MKRGTWPVFLVVVALLLGGLTAPAHAAIPSLPKSSASFNGPVRAVAYLGDTIYVGGDFTAAFVNGKRSYRDRIAAVDARTGALRDFAPKLDGNVYALAVSGSQLYVGGYFTTVDGLKRRHIARFTGGDLDAWRHSVSGAVRALAVSDGVLYAGGSFSTVDGQARGNVASWNLSADTLTSFAPAVDATVRSVTAGANRLYVSGTFNTVNGADARKLAAVDKTSGALDTGFAPKLTSIVYDVLLAHDRVYAAVGGQGGRLIAMDYDGRTRWQTTTDGDVQAITAIGDTIYAGGHFESVCASPRTGDQGLCLDGEKAGRFKFLAVTTSGTLTSWDPWSDSIVGVWCMAASGDRLAAGGEFLTFGNGTVKQRAFAQFQG